MYAGATGWPREDLTLAGFLAATRILTGNYTLLGIAVKISSCAAASSGILFLSDGGRRMMPLAGWLGVVATAAFAGAALVGLLVVPKSGEPLPAILGAAFLGVSGWAFATLVEYYGGSIVLVLALLFGLAGAAGGFALAAALLPALAYHREATDAKPLEAADSGTDDIHVVLLVDAEPERYDPRATASELLDLIDAGAPAVPLVVVPFFFAAQKSRYSVSNGSSPSRGTFLAIRESLRDTLGAEVGSVSLAWTSGAGPTLESTLREIVADGARRVVVVMPSVSESPLAVRAIRSAEALKLPDLGVRLTVAPTLWSEGVVAGLVASTIRASTPPDVRTGVVLVCHALPPTWDERHPSFEAEESAFAHRVRGLLIDGGLDDAFIRLAWAEWRDPDVTESVRHLAALGCRCVLIAPACAPVESITTQFDLPHAARQARAEIGWRVLPAWGDETALADVLADRIRACADEV